MLPLLLIACTEPAPTWTRADRGGLLAVPAPADDSAPPADDTDTTESRTPDDTGDTGDSGTTTKPVVPPGFVLIDENPNSPTFDQKVAPVDFLKQVSGWYFTHAT